MKGNNKEIINNDVLENKPLSLSSSENSESPNHLLARRESIVDLNDEQKEPEANRKSSLEESSDVPVFRRGSHSPSAFDEQYVPEPKYNNNNNESGEDNVEEDETENSENELSSFNNNNRSSSNEDLKQLKNFKSSSEVKRVSFPQEIIKEQIDKGKIAKVQDFGRKLNSELKKAEGFVKANEVLEASGNLPVGKPPVYDFSKDSDSDFGTKPSNNERRSSKTPIHSAANSAAEESEAEPKNKNKQYQKIKSTQVLNTLKVKDNYCIDSSRKSSIDNSNSESEKFGVKVISTNNGDTTFTVHNPVNQKTIKFEFHEYANGNIHCTVETAGNNASDNSFI